MDNQLGIKSLHKVMVNRLEEQDLRKVCFYLSDTSEFGDTQYSDLEGPSLSDKAMSLISYCRKRRILSLLIENLHDVRPDVLSSEYTKWRIWAFDQDGSKKEQLELEASNMVTLSVDEVIKPLATDNIQQEGKGSDSIIGDAKKALYSMFWTQLLDRIQPTDEDVQHRLKMIYSNKPKTENSIRTGGAFSFSYSLTEVWASVDLFIRKVNQKQWNKSMFDTLFRKKEQIEQAFGEPLSWERTTYEYATIRFYINASMRNAETTWPALQQKMIDAMNRLYRALQPFLENLPG